MENKMCFDVLYKFCPKIFLTVRRTERDMNKNVYWTSYCTRYGFGGLGVVCWPLRVQTRPKPSDV